MWLVPDRIKGFLIGAAAGVLALTLSYFFRILAGGVFVPELVSQTLFSFVPGEIEAQAVESLGSFAKYSAFAGAILVNVALYGVLGAFLYRFNKRFPHKRYPVKAIQFSLSAYFVMFAVAAVLLTRTEVLTQPTSIQSLALYLLPPHIPFGFILCSLYKREAVESARILETAASSALKVDHKRRLIISTAFAGAIASTILFYGLDLLFPKLTPETSAKPASELAKPLTLPTGIFADPMIASFIASEVTPNDQFYRVDVNIIVPTVDATGWKLTVKGMVNNPLTLTYEELRYMPAVQQHNTLECISNKIGSDLISNALWKGVPLKDLFEKAQVKPEATYIIFRCIDGYDVGIPLERGLLDGTILAYEMNGVPLPAEHGYPLRAVVPGLYGMMNAKWVNEIDVVSKVHEGFWQRRGWSNTAEYQAHSTIVMPGDNALRDRFRNLRSSKIEVGGKIPVAGIAFAGDRGISKVEVSTDGGKTWKMASIKDPLSEYTWALWAAEWNPPAKGEYKITVRATDKTGKVQTAELRDPFPNGATGYHVVDIEVTAPN